MSRHVLYRCDGEHCNVDMTHMVVFEATDSNLDEKPTYCRKCAVKQFEQWLKEKLTNGPTILIVSASAVKPKVR